MSSGTNSERILENNGIIADNNDSIDNFRTAISNLPSANSQVSYAKMMTTFNSRSYTYSGWLVKVEDWEKINEVGDYVVDETNSRIVISNTEILQINGGTGGNGYGEIVYDLYDANGNNLLNGNQSKVLLQFAGNFYWIQSLQSVVVMLDKTQTYYLSLSAKGYNNKNFVMNDGFGNTATWLSALKLK